MVVLTFSEVKAWITQTVKSKVLGSDVLKGLKESSLIIASKHGQPTLREEGERDDQWKVESSGGFSF